MIINNLQDELKKRENALAIIKSIINENGRDALLDLTGLSGGFEIDKNQFYLLETYIGSAIFEDQLNSVAKNHLGGEKVLAVNRTSAGILATILTLIKEDNYLVHFLQESPSHPSILRSLSLVGGKYIEYEMNEMDMDESNVNNDEMNITGDSNKVINDVVGDVKPQNDNFNFLEKFFIPENTDLIVITGSTMDHKVMDENNLKKIISIGNEKNIPVFVDDASGARLRTAIFGQKKAIEMGADLVITSTDKLMDGPRAGLMAGKKDLIDKIKIKSNQFGFEAQAPIVLAMINALNEYNDEFLISTIKKKDKIYEKLVNNYYFFEKTPTGILINEDLLKSWILEFYSDNNNIDMENYEKLNSYLPSDYSFILSFLLLKEKKIITIPAVSMPGASSTVRFDMASNDAKNLDIDEFVRKFNGVFSKFIKMIFEHDEVNNLIFGNN
ncbi:MAG: aminotransferase class I/II-fold pyridoxal phosphate-dependent enzyme [Methanobrevibacter sp.]|jgi:L-seryl-tRNA(Ser) seleniumtransferase|nr:aminotransferase class I/II-fold pyridoxal phosphate-dependent enzyme [Candidatus Methanoflexus mossambicus]